MKYFESMYFSTKALSKNRLDIKRFQKPSEIYSICQMQDQINSNKKFMKSLSIEGELTILKRTSWSQPN